MIFIGQVVFASGLGLIISPATNSVMQSVPVRKSGVGSAMNDTTRQVGGALGVAVLGSILNAVYRGHLTQFLGSSPQLSDSLQSTILRGIQGAHQVASRLPDHASAIMVASKTGYIAGMHQVLLLASMIMFASAVLTLLFFPNQAIRTADFPLD